MNGILNLDKPRGLSSAHAVARVKRLLPRKTKIGHAGTLDPFATGVLLLLVGKSTRLCESLMDQPKQYEATVRLGATTETDDPESPERPTSGIAPLPREAVEAALKPLVGRIMQRPPVYSALKRGGVAMYELARRGEAPELQPRPVTVYGIALLEYAWPTARLRIDCGRGTYIRAIARDLGEALKVGGYLTELRRTRVGDFRAESASPLEDLTAENVESRLVEWIKQQGPES